MAVSFKHDNSDFTSSDDALEFLSASVIRIDRDERIGYLNQSAESLTGTSRQRANGLSLNDLFSEAEELYEFYQRVRSDGGSVEVREVSLVARHRPEQQLTVDVVVSTMPAGSILLEIRDASNRLRIRREDELNQQNSVSRLIIRQLAHEIKNPLGGLRGAAQLLARRLPTPDLREYTDVIISETDRLVTLVDTMLGPNKPTHRNLFNLHKIVDHVFTLIRSEAPSGVTIERDFDPSLPELLIDEGQMTQALLNLAGNAMHAVGDHGHIVIRTRAEIGFTLGEVRHAMVARIDVQDSGNGIPGELKEKIFYPLVTGRKDGIGLGLAVSQELVHRHGGLIKLSGERPTVFSIYLPVGEES